MLMHKILQNHLLCAFVANLKIDGIHVLYQESFCDKNLAIRKVFAFCDSEYFQCEEWLCDVKEVTWLEERLRYFFIWLMQSKPGSVMPLVMLCIWVMDQTIFGFLKLPYVKVLFLGLPFCKILGFIALLAAVFYHITSHTLSICSKACTLYNLREGWLRQIGWIFGKNPNGLRPPPHFRKIISQFFYNGYGCICARRYEGQILWNACTCLLQSVSCFDFSRYNCWKNIPWTLKLLIVSILWSKSPV